MNNYSLIKLFIDANHHQDFFYDKFAHHEFLVASQKKYPILVNKKDNKNYRKYLITSFKANTFLNFLEIIKIIFWNNFSKSKIKKLLYLLSFYSAKNILYFIKVIT